jgi:hypothetical protein
MNRTVAAFLGALLVGAVCFGQDSSAPAPVGHGVFPVKVTKTLDSSKLKEGDAVELETAGSFQLKDGTLVPKGSKLEGHVAAAKSRAKGDPDSELTLAFEKLNVQGGKQFAVKGTVQAVFPPADEDQGPNMATAGTSMGGSGAGAGSAGVGITQAKSGSNMESSSKPQGAMDSNSTGVQGIHDLSLENGVLSSKGKQVKLGNGVRMMVRADILG